MTALSSCSAKATRTRGLAARGTLYEVWCRRLRAPYRYRSYNENIKASAISIEAYSFRSLAFFNSAPSLSSFRALTDSLLPL
jgi:hypothetical protein